MEQNHVRVEEKGRYNIYRKLYEYDPRTNLYFKFDTYLFFKYQCIKFPKHLSAVATYVQLTLLNMYLYHLVTLCRQPVLVSESTIFFFFLHVYEMSQKMCGYWDPT